MHKKLRIHGHVVHKLPGCGNLYYTVEPEHACIAVYILMYDPAIGEPYYSEFEDISIYANNLGQHGYLQKEIELIARRHSDPTYIRNYLELEKTLYNDTIAGCLSVCKEDLKALNDTINLKHFVLIAKIKSDDDRVMHPWEYIQVVQQGDNFMLLFDNADITRAEAIDLAKYLSGLLSIKDVRLSTNPEFMNYSISFSGNFDFDDDPIQYLCGMLAAGAKHKHVYPLRSKYKGMNTVSSIYFSIQENGDSPIFKKRWLDGLNGYVSINARVYDENGVDVRPYKPLDTDILKFHVRRGKIRLIKYPDRVIDVADDSVCTSYPQVLTTKYHYANDLVKDCRAVLEHFGMYNNASDVKLCWYSDFLDGYSTRE